MSSPQIDAPANKADFGPALGVLAIRIWLGLRSILTGVEKFAGTTTKDSAVVIDGAPNTYGLTDAAAVKTYSLSNYHGIPQALRTQFEAEPLLPAFSLDIYDKVLGPALLLLGITVLLGIAPRISLFLMALLYTSLTLGLILIRQDPGVAWLAAHMILIALALFYAEKDRWALFLKKF
jgi:thiosulfate dehydrogenase [quinone] large subunit